MAPRGKENYFIMKIVIADDSSLWRERIKGILVNNKCVSEVYEAENGVEAFKLIIEKEPDIAILDIRMPEMSGIDVLMKIRQLKMKVKIIILTNYPYPQYKNRCMEKGADYFLSKSDDFEETNIIKMITNE
jgi:YesN/AraC family two-component response regulator